MAMVDNVHINQYKDEITRLLQNFAQQLLTSGELETNFILFCSSFTANVCDFPMNVQLEIIDLLCDLDFIK